MTSSPRPRSLEINFTPVDNARLANLCGALDENLRQIETAYDITIARRGEHFRVTGTTDKARLGIAALERFYAQSDAPVSIDDIQLGVIEIERSSDEPGQPGMTLMTRKGDLHGRTPRQVQYLRQIQDHDITFGSGPAGTGKTDLAVACAVDAMERDQVSRIILTRPAVEAGE